MRNDLRNFPTTLAETLRVRTGEVRTVTLKKSVMGRMIFCRDYSEFADGIQPRKIRSIIIDRHLAGYIGVVFIYKPLPNSEHGKEEMGQGWEGWESDTLERVLKRVQEEM